MSCSLVHHHGQCKHTPRSIGWKSFFFFFFFPSHSLLNTATAVLSEVIDLNPIIQAVMFDIAKLFVNREINEVPMCPTFVKSNQTTCEAFKQHELRNCRSAFSQGKLCLILMTGNDCMKLVDRKKIYRSVTHWCKIILSWPSASLNCMLMSNCLLLTAHYNYSVVE